MARSKVEVDVTADTGKARSEIGGLSDKIGDLGKGGMGLLKSGAELAAKAVVAGAAASSAAVVGIGTAALNAYKDYEQLVGGVDTLFQNASGKLQRYAGNAYQTAGMSANQYMQQATSFSASLVSSLKVNGEATAETYERAADAANMAMVDMSDNVNKMGSNMSDVQNAYQGFAKQNYTMLDNLKLGYGGTKEEMQRLIEHANELRKAQGKAGDLTIDKFSDVVQAIHEVQTEMGITGTTAKEAATTIEGSVNMAKAAWENFLVGIGDSDADMGELTANLIESLEAVAKNVAPRIAIIAGQIMTYLPGAISDAISALEPIMAEGLAAAWNAAVAFLGTLGIKLPELDASQITDALAKVTQAVSDFSEAAKPVIADTVNGLIDGLDHLAETAKPVAEQIGDRMGEAFETLNPVFKEFTDRLKDDLGPVLDDLVAAMGPLVSSVIELAEVALPPLLSLLEPLITGIGQIAVILVTGAGQIIGFIAGVVEAISGALMVISTFFLVDVPAAVSGFLDSIGQIPGAVGGFLSTATATVTGFASDVAARAMEAGSNFLSNISSTIAQVPGTVGGYLGNVVGRISGFVGDMAAKASSAASGFKDSLIEGLNSIPSRVASIGTDIVNGIANGIKDAAGTLISAAKGVVDDALTAAKNLLGIKSPSRVFRDQVGRMIPRGAAIGVKRDSGYLTDSIEDMVGMAEEAANVTISGPEIGAASVTGGSVDQVSPVVDAIAALTDRLGALEYNLGPIIAKNAPRFPGARDQQRLAVGYVNNY